MKFKATNTCNATTTKKTQEMEGSRFGGYCGGNEEGTETKTGENGWRGEGKVVA